MKTIVFIERWDVYNAGERASFPVEQANDLIARGKAEALDVQPTESGAATEAESGTENKDDGQSSSRGGRSVSNETDESTDKKGKQGKGK